MKWTLLKSGCNVSLWMHRFLLCGLFPSCLHTHSHSLYVSLRYSPMGMKYYGAQWWYKVLHHN